MTTNIVTKPLEAQLKLERIGLTSEQVLEIIHAMASAKADATENDPPGAAGWSAWRMGIRRSREVTIHDKRFPDWERDEEGQVSSVLNRKLGVRLLVSNTGDGTGIAEQDRFPQNRSKKGAATDRIVQNNQGVFDFMEVAPNVVHLHAPGDAEQGIVSWYVCVYCEGDELRAEVSCPIGIEGGFFTGFSDRIIVLGDDEIDIDPIEGELPEGEVVDIDVPVSRKK
ncbi:hypothetical protein P8R33_03170 [Qipengyuania sp. XHP0211]|uniref:hypothetical protein n=1 Tax=Qipengyuania sp. XHP0211 TaxID=3038079 RepID=UPI00241DD83D|nr:hypothetical protein [Qipengyuania sp. XHP0211]MDG5750099.1 hypothetical protein [Qipengyuania sp. XHP0211]